VGRFSKIYTNNGPGTAFTRDTTADSGLAPSVTGSVAWGDYNSDGKPEILLTGYTGSVDVSKIYKLNGSGAFIEDTVAEGTGLTAVENSSAAWGDYTSDGKLDILLTGYNGSGYVSKIYQNNGSGVFVEDTTADSSLFPVERSSVAWGDYDADGKPDVLLSGRGASMTVVAKIYRNLATTANTAPTAPSSLSASYGSGVENLSWAAASDTQTPAAALSYNLRVGTTPGGSDVVSPLSLPDGTRLVPQDGNVGEHTSFGVTGLADGTYYWSVQAVDSGFAGSSFATEGTFTVGGGSIAFSSATYSANEGDGTAAVAINRTGLTTGTDTVHFTSADGTATAGSDYTDETQIVTFNPGVTSRTIDIPITDDSQVESSETVALSLSSPSSPATLGTPNTATLTITDNDVAPPVTTTTTTTTTPTTTTTTTPPPDTHPATNTAKGKIVSAKLSKKSFPISQAKKVKLTCTFSPKSKVFKYVLSIKKGKKWTSVKSVGKTGFYKVKYAWTVKELFAGKPVKHGTYRLKLSADTNSKTLGFRVT
jgi:hypothetical protein